MIKGQLFHVIWTTHGTYPVWDRNGNWEQLKELYAVLHQQAVVNHCSHEFPGSYHAKQLRDSVVLLQDSEMKQLVSDITELCQKDRIMTGIQLEMIRVTPSRVELLVCCTPDSLNQKIARLKSRLATLLGSGKGTWGKGIWFSAFLNKEALVVSIVSSFNFSEKIRIENKENS